MSPYRVSNQLSAAMYNHTLPHADEAMAETWEYHGNVAWTQVSWHFKNGTQPAFPVCTKGNASDSLMIKDQIGHMYFQTPFPVPSLKKLTVKFLHQRKGEDPSVPCLIFVTITTLATEGHGQTLTRVFPFLTKK